MIDKLLSRRSLLSGIASTVPKLMLLMGGGVGGGGGGHITFRILWYFHISQLKHGMPLKCLE